MNFQMQKAIMLADNINSFISFVKKLDEKKNGFILNKDKLYQIKLYIEEYSYQVIADELLRINRYEWDEKYNYYLIDLFNKGLNIIDEFVNNNEEDLFILSARIHTLKNFNSLFVEC